MTKPKPTPTRGKAKNPLLSEIQARFNVSRRQAFRIQQQGVSAKATIAELEQARLRKIFLACQKLEQEMVNFEQKYVSRESVRRDFEIAFNATADALRAMAANLAHKLAGLPEARMQPVVRQAVEKMLNGLANRDWPED